MKEGQKQEVPEETKPAQHKETVKLKGKEPDNWVVLN